MDAVGDETVRRAMRWCSEVGVASVFEIVRAKLADEFVAALMLKRAPARLLTEALRKVGDSSWDELHVPIEGLSRTSQFVTALRAEQLSLKQEQQEALMA